MGHSARVRLLRVLLAAGALLLGGAPRAVLAAPALSTQATALLASLGGTTAMIAELPGQPPLVSLDASTSMTSASLYKLGVMAAAYAALARGTIRHDQTVTITQAELDFYGDDPASSADTVLTVDEALRRMVTISDNSAAGALLALLGYPAVNAAFIAYGMPHTHMGSPPDMLPSVPRTMAHTTAADLAGFFSTLLAGRVVSPAASEAMVALLRAQTENDRLPKLLPPSVVVAHKTGELDDVRNDAGVIFTPRGPVICAVLTNDQSDVDAATTAIAQEGRLVYDAVMAGGSPLPDYSVGDGWFYTQANGQGGAGSLGYSITDAGGDQFWAAFAARGGVDALGYPASRRFAWQGFTDQLTQKEVLQWRPDQGTVAYMNVFDILHDDGFDGWLDRTKQIPPPFATAPDSTLTWRQVVARHEAILNRAPAIRARYFADATAVDDYGLPMSVKDYGPVIVVRCQRAAFQYWKVKMPFARARAVTLVNAGDIAKAAGLFPASALQPGPANQ